MSSSLRTGGGRGGACSQARCLQTEGAHLLKIAYTRKCVCLLSEIPWVTQEPLYVSFSARSPRSSPQTNILSTPTQATPCHSRCSSRKQSLGRPTWRATRAQPAIIPTSPEERLLPLVKNELVLAEGSQRTLVLTQGGGRCNDYQLRVERRILRNVNMYPSKVA